jgi:hypothetical protein
MDNSKVNGTNVPSQAQATIAQPTRANPLATDRFSQAMGDGRSAVRGTRISDLTPEGSQQNRQYAYRRLNGTFGEAAIGALPRDAMGAVAKDMSTDDPPATSRTATNAELTQMLERMCSALYVGEQSVGTQRVVMALDHVLPGAAAEIVREGVHLSIRLHARTEESFRSMSSQRDALMRALSSNGERRVEVSVVHGDEKGFGNGHG